MKTDRIVLLDIDNTIFNTIRLKETNLTTFELYDEVKETLASLSKIAKLGIFSQGEIAFQNKKLQETNIQHYFFEEHKHIVEYKIDVMKDVLSRYHNKEKVYFIDDWLDMLHAAKRTDPAVFTIWMKRGEYAHSQKVSSEFAPDAIVDNLRDVLPLIAHQ